MCNWLQNTPGWIETNEFQSSLYEVWEDCCNSCLKFTQNVPPAFNRNFVNLRIKNEIGTAKAPPIPPSPPTRCVWDSPKGLKKTFSCWIFLNLFACDLCFIRLSEQVLTDISWGTSKHTAFQTINSCVAGKPHLQKKNDLKHRCCVVRCGGEEPAWGSGTSWVSGRSCDGTVSRTDTLINACYEQQAVSLSVVSDGRWTLDTEQWLQSGQVCIWLNEQTSRSWRKARLSFCVTLWVRCCVQKQRILFYFKVTLCLLRAQVTLHNRKLSKQLYVL